MALDETMALLRRTPILGLLEPDALRLLAFSAETRRLKAGDALFVRGERSDGAYIVLDGRVGMAARPGESEIMIGPGSLIGKVALFARTARPGSATAREATEVMRVSPTLMRRILSEFPASVAAMRDALATDLDEMAADLDRVRSMMLRSGPAG